jgi:hypothetical protein
MEEVKTYYSKSVNHPNGLFKPSPPPKKIKMHGHIYQTCEGCGKLRRRVALNFGHYVCKMCSHRSKMPMVGCQSQVKWKIEEKLLRQRQPSLSWEDQKVLWKEYMQKGLSHTEAKSRINSLKGRLRWKVNRPIYEAQKQKRILPI